MVWRGIAFALVTTALACISRSSLLRPRSHGFFRFFAWEAIAAMFLLNVEYWFVFPLSWNQLISWSLLTLCCVPAIWGAILLRGRGKPISERASDGSLLAFERTSTMVDSGIYAYIRHPLYCSLLILTWGIFFKHTSVACAGLGLASTFLLFLTARADEAECIAFFGPQYEKYMKKTRRFVPFLF